MFSIKHKSTQSVQEVITNCLRSCKFITVLTDSSLVYKYFNGHQSACIPINQFWFLAPCLTVLLLYSAICLFTLPKYPTSKIYTYVYQ